MSTLQPIAPVTAAATGDFDAAAYRSVVAFATGLGVGETVAIQHLGAEAPVNAVVNGVVAVLTQALPSINLPGGANYRFTKPVTVAASSVNVSPTLA